MNTRWTIFGLVTLGLMAALVLSVVLETGQYQAAFVLDAAPAATFPVADARAREPYVPLRTSDTPPPVINAKSALVVDAETGMVLFEKNADAPLSIASVTKLATALVLADTIDATRVTVQPDDVRNGGVPYVIPGESFSSSDLFAAMLVGSENTAAMALVRAHGETVDVFVEKMNELASDLGLQETHFVEPTGLDANNVSSARDLGRLGRAAFHHDAMKTLLDEPSVTVRPEGKGTRNIPSTNELVRTPRTTYTLTGGKTGYIPEAGYTYLVAAQREEERVIVAVLGSPSSDDRFAAADELIDWALDAWTLVNE